MADQISDPKGKRKSDATSNEDLDRFAKSIKLGHKRMTLAEKIKAATPEDVAKFMAYCAESEEQMKKAREGRKRSGAPVAEDRNKFLSQLQSGRSVLIFETTATSRSHCRAQSCLPGELKGEPNIHSPYRLNLKDITGGRKGEDRILGEAWYNRMFYSIAWVLKR
jgi:hypothetical protein